MVAGDGEVGVGRKAQPLQYLALHRTRQYSVVKDNVRDTHLSCLDEN